MTTRAVPDLLAAWRAAERRWERVADDHDVAASALEVVRTWLAYQEATLPTDYDEFLLVTDDDQRYVGATSGLTRVLGYAPEDILGRRIEDLVAPDIRPTTPYLWARFVADGRQEGEFTLCGADGTPVALNFQARAHHPVPGYHVSRLWPAAHTRPRSRGSLRGSLRNPVGSAR